MCYLCRTIRSDESSRCDEICHVPKERDCRKIMHGCREIVGAWLLSHLLPQKLL